MAAVEGTKPSLTEQAAKLPCTTSMDMRPVKGPPKGNGVVQTPAPNSEIDVLWGLVAFRILNALTIATFFQPDEYFQSLEPAWQMAFGEDSGAWITWEWEQYLRSSIHPTLFAGLYYFSNLICRMSNLDAFRCADVLVAAPTVLQALFAVLMDIYTWKFAKKIYGRGSRSAKATLMLTLCSPWQWFCSTRTLSNSLETTLTVVALYHWPWHFGLSSDVRTGVNEHHTGTVPVERQDSRGVGDVRDLRISLMLGSVACILRPTNVLVWMCISMLTMQRATKREVITLVQNAAICGSVVLAASAFNDRLYYRTWVFPPFRFLYFNLVQSLSVFYGKNRVDYYITEALPLLLTTALPFAITGIWRTIRSLQASTFAVSRDARKANFSQIIPQDLVITVAVVITLLSFIPHKEVRFIYPLLPIFHIISAPSFASFFLLFPYPLPLLRKVLLALFLITSILIAAYASNVHQRGVIEVLQFLRSQHERLLTADPSIDASIATSVGFLMPCHSTPWRSHLVHRGIKAWALTCEPPINVSASRRHTYLDEADAFYADPAAWVYANMQSLNSSSRAQRKQFDAADEGMIAAKSQEKRQWPEYLVFFEQLEPVLKDILSGTVLEFSGEAEEGRTAKPGRYGQSWRGFNSHFHDDWRRRGDVVVWKLVE